VIEPMLAGEAPGEVPPDDLRFLVDLGLLRWAPEGGLVVANPIGPAVRYPDSLFAAIVAPCPIAPMATPSAGSIST
jgi:hypothetical protein